MGMVARDEKASFLGLRSTSLAPPLAFISGIAVLFFEYGDYWSWHFWSKWALCVAIFSTVFSWEVSKRTSLWFFPILAYSLLSAVNSGGIWAANHFNGFVDAMSGRMLDDATQFAIHKGGLYAYLTLVMVGLCLVWLPRASKAGVRHLLAFISFASTACTIAQMDMPSHTRGAFSGNTGMNGSLIAVTLPFWLALVPGKGLKAISAALAVSAILLTQTSIPIGVLAVVAMAYAFSKFMRRGVFTPHMVEGVIALFVAGAWASRDSFLSSSGRFEVWSKIFPWWAANGFQWTGTGLGTATTLIPYAQSVMKSERFGWFIFMHSEPLQILWELGIPGLVFALVAFTWTAWRAFRHPILFASLMGIAAQGLFNYPLRLPISCVSAVLVLWLVLNEERGNSKCLTS